LTISEVRRIVKMDMPRFERARAGRISPEAPVPVVRVEDISDRPGGAGNVALNIASLGAGVAIAAYTGDDEMADSLQAKLHAAGVECVFTRLRDHPTITKLRVISRQQQLLRLDFEEPEAAPAGDALLEALRTRLTDCDVLVLSDYAKGALADPAPLIALAREAGVPVLVDPKGEDFARYRGATMLTPNLQEFETVVGGCASEAELVARGERLMAELQIEALLITRGEAGLTLLRPGEEERTGAGDTVMGVLAAAIAGGADLPDAVTLANIAAGIVVGKLGTAVVSAPELRRAVQQERGAGRGVMSLEQLQVAVADARSQGWCLPTAVSTSSTRVMSATWSRPGNSPTGWSLR
jgi:D-beta-D-heptose 7-phosphate kinase/D-beta-D-heptose 1-phosphate adenosyltransferase